MNNITVTTKSGGFKNIELTFNFDDCTVEHLAPFIVAHLRVRYPQSLLKPDADGNMPTELPKELTEVIRVADLRTNARGETSKAKKQEDAEEVLEEKLETMTQEERVAYLIKRFGIEVK